MSNNDVQGDDVLFGYVFMFYLLFIGEVTMTINSRVTDPMMMISRLWRMIM